MALLGKKSCYLKHMIDQDPFPKQVLSQCSPKVQPTLEKELVQAKII